MAGTMDAPPVQYVTTVDGCRIAYSVAGSGRPVVLLPNIWSHIQLFWQTPWRRSMFEALASRFQLVHFDARGQGLSTRGLSSGHIGAHYCLDIDAVVERAAPQRFVLFARNQFCQVAAKYAARHPDRLDALILGNPARDEYRGFDELMTDRWEVYTESIARLTNLPSDPVSMAAEFRQAVNRDDHIALVRAFREVNMLEDVAKVSAPMLVIGSSTSPLSSQEFSAQVAASAPNAQMVSVSDPSGSSGFFSDGGTVPPAVAAIEHFLESLPAPPSKVAQISGLSVREVEVLRLLADGKSNGEIAANLVISPNTVNRHVSNIYAKTGASNRAEATSFAHRQGLI